MLVLKSTGSEYIETGTVALNCTEQSWTFWYTFWYVLEKEKSKMAPILTNNIFLCTVMTL